MKWIRNRELLRKTDNQKALIYPMGAERYLQRVLENQVNNRYPIHQEIEGKDVLVVPGYANTAFIIANAGARSVTVCDKDPVTIAWLKAYKKYYHYRQFSNAQKPYPSVGELLAALTAWYPPFLVLPRGNAINILRWLITPSTLRSRYLAYLLDLIQEACKMKEQEDWELDSNIDFFAGELETLGKKEKCVRFDTAYVPYLLGVSNGIEQEKDINSFLNTLFEFVPNGRVLITPSQNIREFYLVGQQYFKTTNHNMLSDIPVIQTHLVIEDKSWFQTQGLAVVAGKIRNTGL